MLAAALVRVLYRFRVHGRDRVPPAGPVLVVANRVSLFDKLVLRAACPRPVTFPRTDDEAVAALTAGRVAVVFPEGDLTRSGRMRPFGPGVEGIIRLAGPGLTVIPACTDGLWGSVGSYLNGRPGRKWPRTFRRPVAVMFGEPLTDPRPTAPELQLAVQATTADCAVGESGRMVPVHRAFVRRAVRAGNLFRPCVTDHSGGGDGRTLSWAKTFVASACVAGYLRSRVGDGPHVGVWLPTGLGGALANLALAYLGKASVNLNYTAGPDAVHSAARQAGLKVVVTAKRFTARVPLDLPDDVERIYLEDVLAGVTRWERIRTMLAAVLLPAWAIERFVLRLRPHDPDAALTVIFSSGSTGEPKGVVLTHRNVGANADAMVRTVNIRTADRLLAVLPFFHSFGYTVCLWMPLVSGAESVYFPDPRQAKEVGELCRRHRATLLLGTATFLRFYLRRCGADDFRSLRLLICGAEKLPVPLQDEFEAKFGVRPLEGYGCTELSPVVSTNLPDETAAGRTQRCNTIGTVGPPLMGVCVTAFDPDTRAPLPPGVEGVLWCKGPNVMAGYLGQPGRTKEVVVDGWYNTGDRGLVEPDGFVRITGRESRFAKIAGEMVPLERVEDELTDAAGNPTERVLAVAAVPDEKRGERVVVLYAAELEGRLPGLLAALGKRGLPNLWVPDVRDCHRVDALPLLGSGKLDLRRVAALAKERAGRT